MTTFKMYLSATSVSLVRELPAVDLATAVLSRRLAMISAVSRLARYAWRVTSWSWPI